jgi:hypothetical protein
MATNNKNIAPDENMDLLRTHEMQDSYELRETPLHGDDSMIIGIEETNFLFKLLAFVNIYCHIIIVYLLND